MAVGTIAAASLLIGNTISTVADHETEPALYLHLIFTTTFITGVFQTCLGFFRLGILVDFFSHSTITGFMGGTAVILILQQLKGIFGMKHFATKTNAVAVIKGIFTNRHEIRWETAVLGIIFLVFLQFTRHLVGHLDKGLNPISIQYLNFDSRYLSAVMRAGLITGVLSLAEGIAIGRSFSVTDNTPHDGNKEMIAFGLMNLFGSFTSCYLTSGPFSKTAVNYNAGCKTAMANVVGLGLLRGLLYTARPAACKLGKLPDSGLYRDVEQYSNASTVPGVLIILVGSPVYFSNSTYLKERILRYIQSEQSSSGDTVEHIILDFTGVTSIDTTAIEGLLETSKILERKGIKMSLVNPRLEVMEKLIASKFVEHIGKEAFYLNLDDAVLASQYSLRTSKTNNNEDTV
ncbi:hypothetical protein TSUD_143220 [Trifolium subterraneum]|uniref:STAS domain-containing protein n=1 Tax=Trifolium subterraneum TaxID=3900 RepID=A0A2Z6P9D9_TRISU|nr:hypothetical protein TSUD_143220 [Trifolium subterraneum]